MNLKNDTKKFDYIRKNLSNDDSTTASISFKDELEKKIRHTNCKALRLRYKQIDEELDLKYYKM